MDMTQEKIPESFVMSRNMANEGQRSNVVSVNQLRCSNGARPVHQLPIELLLCIFQSVFETHHSVSNYYRKVCTLSTVCVRWYFVIHNSPQFWKNISVDVKEEGLRRVLQRSSGHLIDIECRISPAGIGRNPEEYLAAFLQTLGSVVERCRTLVLNCLGDAYQDQIKDVLQLPAVSLERLVLDDENVELDVSDIELFAGSSPKLKDVRVVGMECNWSQNAFKGLEVLKLSWVSFTSVKPILDMLRDCPQLQRLEICDCDVSHTITATVQPVSLPHLQVLQAIFDDDLILTAATEQFLDHVSAPLHCALYARPFDGWDGADPLSAAFGRWLFGRQPPSVLEGMDGLELRLGALENSEYLLDFDLFSGSSTIRGGVRGWERAEATLALKCIGHVLQRSRTSDTLTTLKISGEVVHFLKRHNFALELNRLPPITRLELVALQTASERTDIEDVFRGLALHTNSLFSKVQQLTFQHTAPEIVMEIVQAALGEHSGEANSVSENQEKRLDHLEIQVEGHDFDQAEKVVEVLRDNPRIGKVDLYVAL